MKPIARILAVLTGEEGDEATLRTAASVSRPFGAQISVVFFRVDPWSLLVSGVDGSLAVAAIEAIAEQENQAARSGRLRFEQWCSREEIPLEQSNGQCSATWNEVVGEEFRHVSRLGRLSDLIVVAQSSIGSGRAKAIFEAALFETGRPVLLAVAEPQYPMFGTAVVAWNGSIEAGRASAFALPLLAEAERVEVFTQNERYRPEAEARDMARFLSDHGINSEACAAHSNKTEDIGAELLGVCCRSEAGLLVMGAYTHSRLREFIFGGVTRHVLDTAGRMPVLMSH